MAKVEQYKGKPVLVLNPDDKWPFTFGLGKAKLILENLQAIRDFVGGESNQGAARRTTSRDAELDAEVNGGNVAENGGAW